MATTEHGIYYPTGDTKGDFTTIFTTLANSINQAISDVSYDSGWIGVPNSDMMNGWETYNTTGSRVRYRKIGKTVQLDGIIRNGSGTDVFVLPEGFRPSGVWPNFSCPIITSGTTGDHARVRITTAGVVQQYHTNQSRRDSGIGLSGVRFFTD